jgi:hypothetical protein
MKLVYPVKKLDVKSIAMIIGSIAIVYFLC